MPMFNDKNQPKNTKVENMEDLPEPKVKRIDGLATLDDFKDLFEQYFGEKKSEKKSKNSIDEAVQISIKLGK